MIKLNYNWQILLEDGLPTDLEVMSNIWLKDDRVKDIIVKSLLGTYT
jgi:hypothetical protein